MAESPQKEAAERCAHACRHCCRQMSDKTQDDEADTDRKDYASEYKFDVPTPCVSSGNEDGHVKGIKQVGNPLAEQRAPRRVVTVPERDLVISRECSGLNDRIWHVLPHSGAYIVPVDIPHRHVGRSRRERRMPVEHRHASRARRHEAAPEEDDWIGCKYCTADARDDHSAAWMTDGCWNHGA